MSHENDSAFKDIHESFRLDQWSSVLLIRTL